jgi:hypothetical protein
LLQRFLSGSTVSVCWRFFATGKPRLANTRRESATCTRAGFHASIARGFATGIDAKSFGTIRAGMKNPMPRTLRAQAFALLATLMAVPTAWGQSMYRCNSGSGSYISDRPCQGAGQRSELRAIGSEPDRQTYSRDYTPSMSRAPDILPYLSPRCAEMNDAVRTGPTRGLKSAAMSELMTNYRLRCAEDEQAAHQKMGQARSDEREQRRTAQTVQRAELDRARLSVEQCHEMLRNLASRRQRAANLSAGEKGDLDLFEVNYRNRCTSG